VTATLTIAFDTPRRRAAAEKPCERRVEDHEGSVVSTHVTRDPAGAIQLAESATHSPDYALTEYTMYTNQLEQTGTVRVEGDEVLFHLIDGGKESSRAEDRTGPVVVGPTLVGYIFRHLDELRAGKTLPVQLAVLDRLETIGFELGIVESQPGQTRVRMRASGLVYGMLIDPIHFTFESATGKLVRLEGRVPAKIRDGGSWADFDARVDYRYVADAYR
jgi:hypothetical protein